ncbi:MAG TPA: EboA domain-containing protein [Nocardioidaceae bacterium]|nr:EboA domain-containing protein [Nocardioidaceae bacterium]
MSAQTDIDELHAALPADAARALDDMLVQLASSPDSIGRLFPAAARRTARGDIGIRDASGAAVLAEDAVRVALFCAALDHLPSDRRASEVAALYRFGDNDEKRAVLLGLAEVDSAAAPGVLEDALRTNDTRLIGAAMGVPSARLDDDTWRQGVLKCLFVGVPLTVVADLDARTDQQLADMIARYAHERVAAGRDVPADVWRVLDRFPASTALADIEAELDSAYSDRREAAKRLLAGRSTTREV